MVTGVFMMIQVLIDTPAVLVRWGLSSILDQNVKHAMFASVVCSVNP